jgi:transcriptional regulator with XRE-family HTH domain
MEARDFITDLLRAGLTQAQIAERSGVPQPTISKVVRGAVQDVLSLTYRKLQALHQAELPEQPQPAATNGAKHEVRDAA